jgi:uncharacterized SAM-binding protein YcdF (DUF218 family)
VLLVSFSPVVPWYAHRLAGPWTDPRGDTVIVLAGSDLDGVPGENTLLRCLYAVFAYRNGEFRKIVVSGVRSGAHMRNLLVAEGVPLSAITVEENAASTRENAVNVARLLAGDSGSKVLLTSDFHMFRAVRAFRKAGLAVSPRPIPDAGKRARSLLKVWPAFLDEVSETAKIAYYASRGWI